MAELPETLSKLSDVRKQQTASLQTLERLTQQHREWHKAVDDLLQEVDQALKAKQLSQLPSPKEVDEDHNTSGLSSEQFSSFSAREWSKMEPVGSSPNFRGSSETLNKRATRSMSSNSLLRSRTTLAQDFPQVPLRKVVVEVMADDHFQAGEIDTWWACAQSIAGEIVSSRWFEFTAGFVILLNLITIGIEAHLSVKNDTAFDSDFWPGGVERIFLTLYCIEALIRVTAGGWSTFRDLWFLLDLVLILVGLLALLVIPILAAETGVSFEKLLVVRGLRLFRLVRALRMLSHFKIVWRLVYGLLTAGQTILSMTMLIAVSLFIFACVAVELIAKDPDLRDHHDTSIQALVETNFFGLNRALLTLLQFVTLDDIADIYFPLVLEKPYLCAFFFPILIFISIGLMNLVTAALVENAMQTAAIEAEEEKQKLKKKVKGALPSLIEIFHQLDADKSGQITHDEVENVPVSILPPRVLDSLCVENITDIFDYLDVDGTGELSQMEFVEGLLNLCLLDMPISTMQTLKLLQLLRGGMVKTDEKVNLIGSQVQELHEAVCGSIIRNYRV